MTKQAIQVITYLNAIGEVLGLWNVKSTIVMEGTGSKHDNRSMTISDIVEFDVIFASMVTS